MPQGRYIITVYLKDGEAPMAQERAAVAEEVEKTFRYRLEGTTYNNDRVDFITVTWDRVWTAGDSS